MNDITNLAFYNDCHSLSFSKHQTIEETMDAVDGVLDQYRDLIRDGKASDITLQMVYADGGGAVALERLTVTPPSDTDPRYTVQADGIVFEPSKPEDAKQLYNRLSEAMWLDITDDEVNGDRYQAIDPRVTETTIQFQLSTNNT